jgi:MAF protein
MPSYTLYLASSSPRRRELLSRAGIQFVQHVMPVDEDRLSEEYTGPLETLGEYLARRKAIAAYDDLRSRGISGYVLASDTTVLLDGRSLAKPHDADEAVTMLMTLRGREHVVATGVAVAGPEPDAITSATAATRVTMRNYSDEEIARYVATGDPFDKAGAYSIQHPDFQPVQAFKGCHTGVIGLPLCVVKWLLSGTPSLQTTSGDLESGMRCVWSTQCRQPFPPEAYGSGVEWAIEECAD